MLSRQLPDTTLSPRKVLDAKAAGVFDGLPESAKAEHLSLFLVHPHLDSNIYRVVLDAIFSALKELHESFVGGCSVPSTLSAKHDIIKDIPTFRGIP